MKLTTEWYQRKFREIQSRLPDAGLDALLLLDPFNIFYATGFFHQPTERPLAVLVPGAGEPIFFVPLLEEDMARETWVDGRALLLRLSRRSPPARLDAGPNQGRTAGL